MYENDYLIVEASERTIERPTNSLPGCIAQEEPQKLFLRLASAAAASAAIHANTAT